MVPLSVLDLAPVVEGSTLPDALRNVVDLARHAEGWGYRRYWLAEHHNMPGVASAATSVVIGQVAAATSRMRVGAGGIMLPNHAPLVIAEQFGTLDALFPGRIDLGLGRAPGTDPLTTHALRRTLATSPDDFPDDVMELLDYFRPAAPGQPLRAVPGAGARVEVWVLGSSTFGAQLAALLGLPYAFASHFAPAQLMQAIALYRERFRPSEWLSEPHLMLGVNVVAADSDAEATRLATSLQQMFVRIRRGERGLLPPPLEGYAEGLSPRDTAILEEALACTFVGSADTVERGLSDFVAATGADELIVGAQIHDHAARLRSFELTSRLRVEPAPA